MSPAVDVLLALVAQCETLYAKRNVRIDEDEFQRLVKLADDMDTARQLANYGVKL